MPIALYLVVLFVAVIGVLLFAIKMLQDTLHRGMHETKTHVKEALADYSKELNHRMELLSQTTDSRLKEINTAVDKRLAAGFEKSTATWAC